MSKIKLTGSNSGYVEISSAADAGNLTLALPTSGTVLLSNTDNVFTGITTFAGLNITGDVTFNGASYNVLWDASDNQFEFGDNAKLSFGDSSDLQIYHNGIESWIKNNTSTLNILNDGTTQIKNNADNQFVATFVTGGTTGLSGCHLYFNNSEKFYTTDTGTVTNGICTATSFSGSGEGLTRTTQLSHRNMIINGSMMICQRFSVNSANNINNATHTYHVDRFKAYDSTDGILQGEWENDNYSDAGFQYSVKYTPATADTSLSNNQMAFISQVIEMDNMRHLGYGLSYAKTCTLSFYAKASLTGTYAIALINDGTNNRQLVSEFTISNTNWNRYTITIPGDTSGTWNANGLRIAWCLASSSDRHTSTLGSWQSSGTAFYGTSNTVNFMSNTSNTFSLTGVQFEIGSSATPYEHKNYQEEIQSCKRYFQKFSAHGDHHHFGVARAEGNTARTGIVVQVPMRASPTVACNGHRTFRGDGGYNSESTDTPAVISGWVSESNIYTIDFGGHSLNHNQMYCLMSKTTSTTALTLDSEL